MKTIPVILSVIVIGVICGAIHYGDPIHNDFLPGCQFHEQTGLYCIGCGGTRATYLLLHGQFMESLRYNCLCPLFLAVIFYVPMQFLLRKTAWAIPPLRLSSRQMFFLLGVLLAFFALRNIPCFPFDMLAPP